MIARKPVRMDQIFVFWVPLAVTWLMMSSEGPFLAAVIARLGEPKYNLAAFGVSFAVAILVEAPVIMIMSAATALVAGPRSFRKLRNFTYTLNALVTTLMLVMLLTPAWSLVARRLIDLPPEVADLTQVSLLILLPWPAAIGYRRFFQGILIRHGRTRRVAYGTVVRLSSMSLTALGLYHFLELPGAYVGAAALSAGVSAESLATRLMARRTVREVLAAPEKTGDGGSPLGYRKILGFYYPLALTSIISLAVHPLVTFFMGHARFPLESLAVLPVVNSLSFLFRSVGLSYQEVAIAMLARGPANRGPVLRFAAILGPIASAGLGLIALTPLLTVWFHVVSGLSLELTEFAVVPMRILIVLPALSVLLSLQRAILVHGHRTGPITGSALLEVAGIVGVLAWTVEGLGLIGATAAATAFLAGRVAGNAWLIPPCLKVLREEPGPGPADAGQEA